MFWLSVNYVYFFGELNPVYKYIKHLRMAFCS